MKQVLAYTGKWPGQWGPGIGAKETDRKVNDSQVDKLGMVTFE